MRPDEAEKILIEELFWRSAAKKKITISAPLVIRKLTGDASTRRYYRLQGDDKREKSLIKGNVSGFVVCLDNPINGRPRTSDFLVIGKLLAKFGVRVPIIYDYSLSKGYYLEEDLGDVTFLMDLAKINNLAAEYIQYEKLINLMIKFQQIGMRKSTIRSFEGCACFSRFFDQEKLMNEINFGLQNFVVKFLEIKLSLKDQRIFSGQYNQICEVLANQKMVFCHRDYHSRNVMMTNNLPVVIDFQDARMGIPQYDLVSLLEDAYYRIDPYNINKLQVYYWENFLKSTAFQKSYEEYMYYYDLMSIQRIFKAIGSFSYIFHLRQDLRYLKYIGYCFENLKSKLIKHQKFQKLRLLLSSIYYEH